MVVQLILINQFLKALRTQIVYLKINTIIETVQVYNFKKKSKTRILIADPAFPITKQILNDRWQIFYDPTFTGYQNIRFVPRDTVVSNANSKDINDVLETYFYQGVLPIPSFIYIYMMIVPISEAGTNNYIIGTFFPHPNHI